jgi:hypothetical protein
LGVNLSYDFKKIASIYIDQFGLSVTPVKGKIPSLKGWQEIHGDSILAGRYDDKWLYATGIGMLTGKPSGIIALDIDITQADQHLKPILDELLTKIPPLYLGRIGNRSKPPLRFFKFNGEASRKWQDLKIELLSTGNQCLMPPSLHPDTGDRYTWAENKLSQIDLDLLPDLDPEVIKWLDLQYEKAKENRKSSPQAALTPGNNRCNHGSHNLISAFAIAKFRAGLVRNEIIDAVLNYDKTINAGAPYLYFNCPSRKEWKGRTDCKVNAEKFVNQIFNNPTNKGKHGIDAKIPTDSSEPGDHFDFHYTDKNGVKRKSQSYEDYIKLFNFMFPKARKDYFNQTVFYPFRSGWQPVENQIRVIRAEARICGLNHTLVEDNLYKWFDSFKPRLLIDIPDWDGTDHISNVLNHLRVTNVSQEHFVELFKAWLAGIFKRVYKPAFHNQCVILKGAQGIGKDMFLGNIFKSLNDYYSEVIIQPRQKDNYESIEPLMVSYLPEFDESSRIPISTIKAFISASKATFRGAYDRKASSHTFRHSVVSSANFDNILRDPTGNRRFWIFEVDSIDWKYNDVLDSGQFIAQSFSLFKEGYMPSKEALKVMKEYIKENTPMSNEELFMEDFSGWFGDLMMDLDEAKWNDKVGYSKKFPKDGKVRWEMISHYVVGVAKRYGFAARTAQSIIKKYGYSDTDRKSTHYIIPKNVVKH